MKRAIRIHLGEEARPVDTLHYAQEGALERAAFECDTQWLADPDRCAIEPGLPLVASAVSQEDPGWLRVSPL